jgi:hypothetical protein
MEMDTFVNKASLIRKAVDKSLRLHITTPDMIMLQLVKQVILLKTISQTRKRQILTIRTYI